MAKKNSSAAVAGGVLLLLGSLVYLYVLFSWYNTGSIGSWLSAASFLTPFVAAVALVGSISLFFMSIGTLAGKMADKMMVNVLWKFVMLEGIVAVIVTATSSSFYAAIGAFILTYLGALAAGM
jgi:hypothetical protein